MRRTTLAIVLLALACSSSPKVSNTGMVAMQQPGQPMVGSAGSSSMAPGPAASGTAGKSGGTVMMTKPVGGGSAGATSAGMARSGSMEPAGGDAGSGALQCPT